MEGTNLSLWDWNIKAGKVKFNETWANMLGYDVEELDNSINTWKNYFTKIIGARLRRL